MRIVVTGGAGFIGSHIVDMLVELKHEVLVIDDLSSGRKAQVSASAKLFVGDVRTPEVVKSVVEFNPDVIIHAAAQMSVRRSMEDPRFDVAVNVGGIVNLLDGVCELKPYFLFISTGGAIYGEQEEFPAGESHPKRPNSVYGLSKYVSEQYLDLWHREFGLKYSVLRLGNVYGPRQNPHGEAGVVAIFCQNLIGNKEPTINGSGEQTRDFIYVGDVVNAVKCCITQRVEGTFNIGTGHETSVNTIYKELVTLLGRDKSASYGPAKLGEQMRSCISSELAKRSLGWRADMGLNQGLASTLEWFQKQEELGERGNVLL